MRVGKRARESWREREGENGRESEFWRERARERK